VEVGAERAGDLTGEERGQGLAGDAADHLADEKPFPDRVVAAARLRAGLGGVHRV
jgi:hypothetical protein